MMAGVVANKNVIFNNVNTDTEWLSVNTEMHNTGGHQLKSAVSTFSRLLGKLQPTSLQLLWEE